MRHSRGAFFSADPLHENDDHTAREPGGREVTEHIDIRRCRRLLFERPLNQAVGSLIRDNRSGVLGHYSAGGIEDLLECRTPRALNSAPAARGGPAGTGPQVCSPWKSQFRRAHFRIRLNRRLALPICWFFSVPMEMVARGTKIMPAPAPLTMMGQSSEIGEMSSVRRAIQMLVKPKATKPATIGQRLSSPPARTPITGMIMTAPMPRGLTAIPAAEAV
jgi:hypothetical protein